MDTVLITGGTGLVGRALTKLLTEVGYRVIILSRKAGPDSDNALVSYAHWDVAKQTIDETAIQQADYIVHLAGANVAEKRWTAARKKEIGASRTQSAALLYKALEKYPNKVKKVISASGAGYYGEDKGGPAFTEKDPPSDDFLGHTCVAWETSILQMRELQKKVVIIRTGIALSLAGGALKEFYKPLQFGFATILGNGEQYISWIHLHDLARIYLSAIVNHDLEGIYNAAAPHPVQHKELVITMAQEAKGKSFISVHVPSFALKLALGEMSVEVLKSCRMSAAKIQETGFVFSYPDIRSAMEKIFQEKDSQQEK
ncbi:TIGR01777 family oxidoreductase [Chitinophaga rhizophila]|uniref:TIGR01777 family oxidoreductase n=1 Tax=Chitinophaga rhizophila TaxID=2866212 RepID=A0ABS7GCY7_9BACT|nr:TIGR01777 family oxidoreductase [Chitinophaga rhizophila]MBW8685540.1 TIGR01777 family oxidoreductase [Chitinophaga rhizophila]